MDYSTLQQTKDMLGGVWGNDQPTGSGSTRDGILDDLITRCSRMFDRATGRPTNYFAAGSGVTRRFSGNGSVSLTIDEFDAITAVIMTSDQPRTTIQTLSVSDPTSPNFVQVLPVQGPPYYELFLLRGFLPDVYEVGNVAVTGTIQTPADVTHAVAVWVAYEWKAREAGWADAANQPGGPGVLYIKGVPPETQRIIDYYKAGASGGSIHVAMVSGGEIRSQLDPWAGWRAL